MYVVLSTDVRVEIGCLANTINDVKKIIIETAKAVTVLDGRRWDKLSFVDKITLIHLVVDMLQIRKVGGE